MTFADLVRELKTVREQIEGVDPESIQADDLAILELQIQRKIAVSGFDPLTALPSVAVPGLTQLKQLGADLKKAIADEKKRVYLTNRILSVAKNAATVAGLRLP